MNKSKMKKMQRLQSVLDNFGTDRAHWPINEQELWGFMQDNPQAEKLYQEARALDQLLDQAILPTPEISSNLQQFILADFAALHETKDQVVVPISTSRKRGMLIAHNDNNWMSAAALAACFAFGIYLGGVGIGDWSLDLAANLANLASGTDQFAEIADAVMSSSFEEELL